MLFSEFKEEYMEEEYEVPFEEYFESEEFMALREAGLLIL